MKRLLALVGLTLAAVVPPTTAAEGTNPWRFEELSRRPAVEARQGVAATADALYAIGNHELGKYDRATGRRLARWECPEGDPLTHLNAGVVYQGRLYCAHSNYPGVPMFSSVEIWDTDTLRHVGSHSFGRTDGSLTWFVRRNDRWLACFVHYAKRGGEPGRGPEWTRLVEYDDSWRPTGAGWVFPPDLVARLASRGYSISGGALGPGGHLFVTGHDEPEFYILKFPEAGPALRWVGTVPMTGEGQAFAWDPVEPGVVHLILKRTREIITGRVTGPQPQTKPD